jgi:hypothetical protein
MMTHYVIWVRPCMSIMPWRVMTKADGSPVVFRDAATADEYAMRCAYRHDHCAVVAAVELPMEMSGALTATLSNGEVRRIDEC